MTVAVLALQGAFIEHEHVLEELGVKTVELRQAADLDQPYDGLILPGGESTVQGKLLRGYADGTFEVKTAWDGEVLATLEVQYTNVWEKYTAPVTIPDGIQALYLTYRGNGNAALRSFELS